MTAARIELRDVSMSYAEGDAARVVLRSVTAHFLAGEVAGLLGRSGSGKSTLLHLIGGIDVPSSGHITVDGVDLASLDERARTEFRRRHVGFVFQFFHLLPTLTVVENVELPLQLERSGHAREDRRRAQELLARVGMAERCGAFPDVLSGGEQQRVAIARALVHRPRVVLADEPTGNLDERAAREVLALLLETAREVGSTVILATHSAAAAAACDRVLTIDDGCLREMRADPP